MPRTYFSPNEIIGGRFKVLGLLGDGATSQVYCVGDTQNKCNVVLKVLHPHLCTEQESIERFRREFIVGASVLHANIARAYELIELEGTFGIMMEYAPGINLDTYLFRKKPDLPEIERILLALLDILEHCHALGIVHRDIKPKNIVIRPDGSIMLLDFGVAHLSSKPDLTCQGAMLGTPEYMAPELFTGGWADLRCDIYSTGILLYECLTGSPPFVADTIPELAHMHLEKDPPAINDEELCPKWLWRILSKMIAKVPSKRYLCCREAKDDLALRRVRDIDNHLEGRGVCINCGRERIGALPYCPCCGTWYSVAYETGNYDVVLQRVSDNREMLSGLRTMFPGAVDREAEKTIRHLPCQLMENINPAAGKLLLAKVIHLGAGGKLIPHNSLLRFAKYSLVATAMFHLAVIAISFSSISPLSLVLLYFPIRLFRYIKQSLAPPLLDKEFLSAASAGVAEGDNDILKIGRMLNQVPVQVRDLCYTLFSRLHCLRQDTRHPLPAELTDAITHGARLLIEGIASVEHRIAKQVIRISSHEQLLFVQERLINRFLLLTGSTGLLLAKELNLDIDSRAAEVRHVLDQIQETLLLIDAHDRLDTAGAVPVHSSANRKKQTARHTEAA